MSLTKSVVKKKPKGDFLIDDYLNLLIQNLNCVNYCIDLNTFLPKIYEGDFRSVTGYKSEEFISGTRKWFEIIHPGDLELVKKESQKLRRRKTYVSDNEYRIISKSGEIKWIRDLAKKTTYAAKKKASVCGIFFDITKTKKVDEELRESEERYRVFFNNNSIITLIVDPENYNILDANEAACNYYGWTHSQITRMNVGEINTLSREELGQEITRAADRKKDQFYFKHRLANGSIRDVEVSSGPIVLKGIPVLYSTIKDITEKKLLEEKLLQMQTTIEKARDTVFWIGPDAQILYVNESACSTLEYTREELLELSICDIDPYLPKDIWASHWEKTRSLQSYKIETIHITKSGKLLPMEISINFISFGGREYHAAFGRNITERKQAEEALEKFKNMLNESQQVAHIGSWELDTVTKELIWSDESFRIMGVDNIAFTPTFENFVGLIEESDRKNVIGHLEETMSSKLFKDLFYKIPLRDGSLRWVHNTGKVYCDENGDIVKMIGTIQDITEQRITQQTLQASEDKFSKAFRTSPDSININRLKDGVYFEINDGFTKLTGYTKEDAIGKSSLELNIWANPEDRKKLVNEILKNGVCNNLEALFRKKDGSVSTGLLSAGIIDIGGEKCLLSITRDISERKAAEVELQESQEKYYQLFELGTESVFLIDNKTGYLLEANNAATTMYGFTRKELLSMHNYDLSAEPDETQHVTHTSPQGIVKIPLRFHKRKDGLVFPVEIIGRFFKWKGRDVHVAAIRDITERRNAEEAMRESEERFHLMFENNGAAMLLIEPETGNIIDANRAAINFYGYSHEKLCSLNSVDINTQSKWQLTQNRGRALSGEKNYFILNHRLASGEIKTVEAYSSSITVQNKTFIFVIIHDINERIITENELRLRSAALEAAANAVVISDYKGILLWANISFSKLTGYDINEVIGKSTRLLKSGLQNDDFYKNLWATILLGNVWRGEIINKRKDGSFYTEDMTITPLKDDSGSISHFIAIKQDITERKKFELELIEAKEKAVVSEELKSAFLAQMSHEIRSPLYRILGYISLIKEAFENSDIKNMQDVFEYFSSIDLSSQRLTKTIDSILNMSELQTQSYKPNFKKVDLQNLMELLRKEYMLQASLKMLELTVATLTKNTVITCDEYSVTQIFANLIDNALKYTDSGEVKIILDVDKKNQLYVEVRDTGIGITKEFLNHLFDPFTQEEVGYTRKFEGNGLGLALVKSYCDINNAVVEIDSEKGKGTTFRIIFK